MKAMVISIAACLTAGCGGYVGYRIGCAETKQAWHFSSHRLTAQTDHEHHLDRVSRNTQVLQDLADGKLSEAREKLESDLDGSLVRVVAYEMSYSKREDSDVEVVRAARDYRSHHPWAFAPSTMVSRQQAEEVQRAFKWAH